MAERVVILIRHGQFEPDGTQPELGPRLTRLGKQQALATGKYLRDAHIQRFYSSPMNRAYETAMLITSCIPQAEVRQTPLLQEVIPTPVIGMRVQNLRQNRINADKAFEQYFKPPRGAQEYDCLVCHGNLIRYLLCRVLGAAAATWLKFEVCHHCALAECRINARGEMRVCRYNDLSHLTKRLRTVS